MKTLKIPTTIKNEARVQRRREQIVLAAIRVFSEKGYHEATLRDLSKETGISHGNIYDYVASKEDIFFLIHQYIADLIDSELTEVTKEIDDPVEKLYEMVRCEFRFIYKWEDAILLLYQEGHVLRGEYLHNLLKRERDHYAKYETVLEECIERQMLPACNVRVIATFIKIMIDSLALKRWDLKKHASYSEVEKCLLDFVFNRLMKKTGSGVNVSKTSRGTKRK
jgi:3-oxoacyl-[acyl-carrier protein] reductase